MSGSAEAQDATWYETLRAEWKPRAVHLLLFAKALQPRAAGLPVLHEQALPFPLGDTREEFVRGVRVALADRLARDS
jgi:hypothetical protein